MSTISKHRPTLTYPQLKHILYLCRTESPLTDESIGIISYLAPFLSKIDNNASTPAYSVSPSSTSLESLGISPSSTISKEKRWENAFKKWSVSPHTCNVQELLDAHEYRYVNNLMDAKETKRFEASPENPLDKGESNE